MMSCEAFAILQALQLIEETIDTQVAILTDSKSTLDVLPNALCTNPTIQSRGSYPALGHFSFSNFFKQLLAEIWKNKNNGLKEW